MRSTNPAAVKRTTIEPLENRLLFHLEIIAPLPVVELEPGATSSAITLTSFFDNEDIPGSVVRMTTDLGVIDIALLDAAAPMSVTNFLNYVNNDRYNGTIIHRSAKLQNGNPFVIQGGGFTTSGTSIVTDQDSNVPNEFDPVNRSNVRGTIAYAKGSDPDSATSQFFFNLTDNSGPLNNPLNSGGFTVFGNVIAGLTTVVDAIAALPREQAPLGGINFNELPVEQDIPDDQIPDDELVVVTDATRIPEITFTAMSSDPNLVTPAFSGDDLTLTANAQATTGTASITVVATDVTGAQVQQTFAVNVEPGSVDGELTVNLGGDTGLQSVSFNDADGTAATIALNSRTGATSTVRLLGTGLTSTTGRRGLTVSGNVTGVREISVDSTSGPADTLNINARGGDGRITVNEFDIDGSLKSIMARTVDLVEAVGGGGIDVAGTLSRLDLGSANVLSISFNQSLPIEGSGIASPVVNIAGTTMVHSLLSGVGLKSLSVGGTWNEFDAPPGVPTPSFAQPINVTTPSIGRLSVTGDFAPNLVLGATGNALASAAVSGAVSGDWALTGGAGRITLGSTTAAMSATFGEDVASLSVTGNLLGDVTARSIKTMTVKGDYQDSALTLTLPFASGAVALSRLTVAGLMSGVTIRSDAGIGSVTTGKAAGSAILAGVDSSVGSSLPDDTADFINSASIAAFTIKSPDASAFSGTVIGATTVGKVNLGRGMIGLVNGSPFGVAADRIASLTFVDGSGQAVRLRNLDDPTATAAQIEALALNLGEFEIRMI